MEGWEVCTDRKPVTRRPKLDRTSVERDAPSSQPAWTPMGGEP